MGSEAACSCLLPSPKSLVSTASAHGYAPRGLRLRTASSSTASTREEPYGGADVVSGSASGCVCDCYGDIALAQRQPIHLFQAFREEPRREHGSAPRKDSSVTIQFLKQGDEVLYDPGWGTYTATVRAVNRDIVLIEAPGESEPIEVRRSLVRKPRERTP